MNQYRYEDHSQQALIVKASSENYKYGLSSTSDPHAHIILHYNSTLQKLFEYCQTP
jgi:hypothetical protein